MKNGKKLNGGLWIVIGTIGLVLGLLGYVKVNYGWPEHEYVYWVIAGGLAFIVGLAKRYLWVEYKTTRHRK